MQNGSHISIVIQSNIIKNDFMTAIRTNKNIRPQRIIYRSVVFLRRTNSRSLIHPSQFTFYAIKELIYLAFKSACINLRIIII